LLYCVFVECNNSCVSSNDRFVQDKIIWDTLHTDVFLENLFSKADKFNFLNDKSLSGDININECMDGFSSLMHDISFKTFSKTVSNKPDKSKRLKPPWFNNECKLAKMPFMMLKDCLIVSVRMKISQCFSTLVTIYAMSKGGQKDCFSINKNSRLERISKSSPRDFWKYIKRYKIILLKTIIMLTKMTC